MKGNTGMYRRLIMLAILLISCFLLVPVPALAAEGEELLVKYRADAKPSTIHGLAKDRLQPLGVRRLKASSKAEAEWLLQELRNHPDVEYAEYNHRRTVTVTASDPEYSTQWGLASARFPEAWEFTRGSTGVLVAVIDSGIALYHPELQGRYTQGYDYVFDDTEPDDELGHGTSVAGVIAANTGNGQGVAGATWHTTILPLKVLDQFGSGYDSDVAAAIIYAADQGADVINLSLGGPEPSKTLQEAVDYAHSKGAVIVAASGNKREAVYYPAACNNVIAVGSISQTNAVSSFSNYGEQLDVAAPGESIRTIGLDPYTTRTASGTSFAAPHVAALASLLLSLDPSLSNSQVESYITHTAIDQGAAGWDPDYGHGAIDAKAATLALLNEQAKGTVSLQIFGQVTDISITVDGVPAVLQRDTQGEVLLPAMLSGAHSLEVRMKGYLPYRTTVDVPIAQAVQVACIPLYGDLNGDGTVDLYDLVAISRQIGSIVVTNLELDPDQDGQVTLLDLAQVAANYGR